MHDKNFLAWLHQRLIHVHRENPNADYMSKLRAIIENTHPSQETPNVSFYSLEVIRELAGRFE